MRPVLQLAAALVAVGCMAAPAAQQAEYAIRWNPAAGGPASAKAALAALGQKAAGEPKAYEVRYYDVAQPAGAPPGFRAVGRERRSGNGADATYKLRGPDPPPPGAFAGWTCPLTGPAESKREVDVGWTGGPPRRSHSLSCTAETSAKDAFPPALAAVAGQCSSRMERSRAGQIKLEHWTFADGTQLFEVSTGGVDDADSLARFRRQVVEPLTRHGVKPLPDSKTELGSAC